MTRSHVPSRRPLALATSLALALALAACGGSDSTEEEDSSQGVTQDPSVEFTGDPVKVMTMAPINTDIINSPSLFTIAQGAVTTINNAGDRKSVV